MRNKSSASCIDSQTIWMEEQAVCCCEDIKRERKRDEWEKCAGKDGLQKIKVCCIVKYSRRNGRNGVITEVWNDMNVLDDGESNNKEVYKGFGDFWTCLMEWKWCYSNKEWESVMPKDNGKWFCLR